MLTKHLQTHDCSVSVRLVEGRSPRKVSRRGHSKQLLSRRTNHVAFIAGALQIQHSYTASFVVLATLDNVSRKGNWGYRLCRFGVDTYFIQFIFNKLMVTGSGTNFLPQSIIFNYSRKVKPILVLLKTTN